MPIAKYFQMSGNSPSPSKSATKIPLLVEKLLDIEAKLTKRLSMESFVSADIATTYNPLVYAHEPHQDYLIKYASTTKQVMFLGMNPGPYGMCQNGVPFGEIKIVREWLKVQGKVYPPNKQNSKRPIEGFQVKKSEVSGQRLWGLFKKMAGTPQVFFENCLVYNYCPLCFVSASGKNVAPNQLSPAERKKLIRACDEAMRDIIELLQVHTVVGVGKWTEERLKSIKKEFGLGFRVLGIMHPSPLNPQANTDYAGKVKAEFDRLELTKYIVGEGSSEVQESSEGSSKESSFKEN